jgi:hypothetical protein
MTSRRQCRKCGKHDGCKKRLRRRPTNVLAEEGALLAAADQTDAARARVAGADAKKRGTTVVSAAAAVAAPVDAPAAAAEV